MSSQGRWKRTREEIISQVLNKYSDLNLGLKQELRSLLEMIDDLSIGVASKTVSARLGKFSAVPQTSEKYWVQRGWSSEEAVLRSRERKLAGVRKKDNIKSPFGRDYWIEKINPATGNMFTIEEADVQRNSLRPIRKEYWKAKGHSEEDSILLAKEAKDKNNKNGKTKNSTYAPRTIGYYLVRGHSKEEAVQLLSEAQSTFSIEKLIIKYGVEDGTKRWQDRQDKWQNTLNSKSHEEQEDINQRKIWKSGSMSQISLSLFKNIDCDGARWGKKTESNKGEMMINLGNRKRAMIDFSVGNKLIEFYGDYWHANPSKYKADDIIITRREGPIKADNIWKIDNERNVILKKLGYDLLIIWENEYRINPQGTIEKCKNFLNQ